MSALRIISSPAYNRCFKNVCEVGEHEHLCPDISGGRGSLKLLYNLIIIIIIHRSPHGPHLSQYSNMSSSASFMNGKSALTKAYEKLGQGKRVFPMCRGQPHSLGF